jgi:hypothetical protein
VFRHVGFFLIAPRPFSHLGPYGSLKCAAGRQNGTSGRDVVSFAFRETFVMPARIEHELSDHPQLAAGETETAADPRREAAYRYEDGRRGLTKNRSAYAEESSQETDACSKVAHQYSQM